MKEATVRTLKTRTSIDAMYHALNSRDRNSLRTTKLPAMQINVEVRTYLKPIYRHPKYS